jgi:ssDNA-binding Zn-finger/Zn-ribbon topoisomerase 1
VSNVDGMIMMTNNPGKELQAKRIRETKTCPECGGTRNAVIRALDTCPKCRDRLRKREKAKDKKSQQESTGEK